jgi:hypothetical protein
MRSWAALALVAAIFGLPPGCSRRTEVASSVPVVWVKAAENVAPTNHFAESSSGPYKVTTNTDVPLSASIQGARATVAFAGRKLVVDFDTNRLLLDDVPELTLPSGTKHVKIRFAAGKLSVTADGADVPKAPGNQNGR